MKRWLCGLAMSGCLLSPIPDPRTPADRARELLPKCGAAIDRSVAFSSIEAVEAEIAHVPGGPNGREARFRGARLRLRPSAANSAEAIQRALQCHESDVTLGRAAMTDDDPYALPDRWLSIDVESAGDGFVVHVRADSVDDARRVLARAKAFIQRNRQSPPASAGHPAPLQ